MSASDDARAQQAIDEQAGLWFAQERLGAEAFDRAAFDAWLADPRCREAYARVARAASLLEAVKDADVLPRSLRLPKRRASVWIASAAGLAAAAAAAVLVFGPFDAPQARYATEIAEIESVTLPDGSVVTLGPVSRLDVRFSNGARRVALVSGEAFFDVAHDANRPFSVDAGDATVVVKGTQFDVRRGDGVVRVAVARGEVQVDAAPAIGLSAPASAVLRAGDQVDAPEHVGLLSTPSPLVLSRLSPDTAGAWRQGHLSYIEAPLSELIADLNRYYAPGIRLSDPELGAFRLTASFRVEDVETFLSTLPEAAPVSVTRGPGGEVVIAAAD